jgi:hypothetical protein
MKKLALYAAAAMTAATAFTTPSNAGPITEPQGRKCAFNSATDVTREAGWQTGQSNGGPLVTGAAGTLHCTLVVNGDFHNNTLNIRWHRQADAQNGVVVMAPEPMNYQATAADDISMCTRWEPVVGPTLYWVSQPAPQTGYWSTDPGANCGVSLSIEPNDPTCRVWHSIDNRIGTNIAEIWQDCEGYPPII